LFCFLLVCIFVLPFSFTFFAFPFLSPFHSKYHHCYYYKLKIFNFTQYRDNKNTKSNDRKTEKIGKPVSPQEKISTGTREMKKTDTQTQTPTK
jgi:hypothetical protein